MIVDYKSSKRDFNFTKALSGLELQLMTYWEALSDAEAIEVGGATYFNAQTPLLKLDKEPLLPDYPSLLAYADEKAQQGGQYTGVLRQDDALLSALDTPEGDPKLYGFEYKKSGDALKSGHETYSDDELNTLIDYNRYMIQHIAERILQGSFPLQPFRDKQATGLQHSDYLPVMFFDAMLGNKYHDISQLPSNRNGALEAMHRKMTEPDSTEEDNQ